MKTFNEKTRKLADVIGTDEFINNYQKLLNDLKIEQQMVMSPEDLKTVKIKLIRLKSLWIAQVIKYRMDFESIVPTPGYQ